MPQRKKSFNLQKFIRILSLSVLVLVFLSENQAQDKNKDLNKGEFQAGLKLGVCTSQIYGDDFGGYNKVGLMAGPFVTTKLKENLNLQIELNYCNRGSRDPSDPKNGKFDTYRISLNYVDIPILLKFWIWKFEFEAGLNNGVFISQRESDKNGLIPQGQRILKITRYELAANLGVNVPINDQWFGNARFHYSVLPVNPGGLRIIPNYGLAGGLFNNAIMISFNRTFRQKEK